VGFSLTLETAEKFWLHWFWLP